MKTTAQLLALTAYLTAVSRSTHLPALRRTVNEYQPYGWVIIQRRWVNVRSI